MYVKFFCRPRSINQFKGKPVYDAFPRPDGSTTTSAEKWASLNQQEPKVLLTENEFTEVHIDATPSYRYRSGPVLKALVYNEEEDAYLKIDFRLDGVISAMQGDGIVEGEVFEDMGLIFSSSSYKLCPLKSKEFLKYKESVETIKEPKPSLVSQGYSSKVEVGKAYIDKKNNVLTYIGLFECIESRYDEKGGKYHAYISKHPNGYALTLVKTKLMVKEAPSSVEPLKLFDQKLRITRGTISAYGFYGVNLDLSNNTFELI